MKDAAALPPARKYPYASIREDILADEWSFAGAVAGKLYFPAESFFTGQRKHRFLMAIITDTRKCRSFARVSTLVRVYCNSSERRGCSGGRQIFVSKASPSFPAF